MKQRVKSLLTPAEACKLLPGVNRRKLHRLHLKGKVKRWDYNKRTHRFPLESVLELRAKIESGEVRIA